MSQPLLSTYFIHNRKVCRNEFTVAKQPHYAFDVIVLWQKMPLFNNKFSPKTIPVRKQDTSVIKNELGSDYASKELSLEIGPLNLKLGDFEVFFDDGQWIPASGKAGVAHKENIRLKHEVERLEEENNMLRLKFEILLDMMTDKTVEAEQQADIQRAQSMGSIKQKSKKRW